MPDQTFLAAMRTSRARAGATPVCGCGRSCLQTAHSNCQSGKAAIRSAGRGGLAVQVRGGARAGHAGRGWCEATRAGRRRRGLAVAGQRRCGCRRAGHGRCGSPCGAAGGVWARTRHGTAVGHDRLGSSAGTKARWASREGSGDRRSVGVTGRNEIRPGSVGRAEGNSPDAGEYSAFFNRSFNGWQSARASVQGPSCAIA
jgi:hypothetical protein